MSKSNTSLTEEGLRAAMRQAFSLGQIYWDQANGDFISQHRKSDKTQAKFIALVEETVVLLAKESP